jgi:hypothetical protein
VTSTKSAKSTQPKDYGPIRFPDRLGIPVWGLRAGAAHRVDSASGPDNRAVAGQRVRYRAGELDQIQATVGTQPDVGAGRAAEVLSARFDLEVDPDVLLELDRMGLIKQVGDYKDHPVYDGRSLELFEDREALQQAITNGRLLNREEVADYLRLRRSDVEHLVRGLAEDILHQFGVANLAFF